jgi:hypothetical protein
MNPNGRNPRLKNILAAGGLTALVLITLLALVGADARRLLAGDDSPALQAGQLLLPAPDSLDGAPDPAALQTQNAELQAAVQTLLEREAAYQARLDEANQAIQALESQPAGGEWWDDDHDGDGEHDDHEEDEHEEHEEGDDD